MKKLIVVIVIMTGALLCLAQLGRTQELKGRISDIKRERAELKTSKPSRKHERPAEQGEMVVPKVMALVQELEKYRGGGRPEKWAALGLAIFELPPAAIPDLAQKLWAEDFSPKQGWIVQAIIEHWSRYDLEAAMEAAVRLKGPHRVRALQGLINPLLAKNPARFEAFVLKNPIERGLSTPYIEYLVKRDPRTAAEFVLRKMGGPNDATIHILASSWTRRDPKAALGWATALSDKPRKGTVGQRSEAVGGVFRTWHDIDRETALKAALKLEPRSSHRNRALAVLIGEWACDDADAAFNFLFDELPVEDRNQSVLDSIDAVLGGVDADKVIDAAKRIEAPELREVFLEEAAFRQTYYSNRGLELADLMSEGKRKDYVYKRAAQNLASHDMAEAIAWLGSLPESRSREAAVTAIIPRMVERDPKEAVNWAQTITNHNTRKKTFKILVEYWLRNDRAAATAWVETCEVLLEEEKALLLR